MNAQGFGRKSGAAGAAPRRPAPAAAPEKTLDEEFEALMTAARAKVDKETKRKQGKVDTPPRERKPFKLKLGPTAWFYLAAVAVWILGLAWLVTQKNAIGILELALTQLPVAGLVIAAQLYKKKA